MLFELAKKAEPNFFVGFQAGASWVEDSGYIG